MPKPPFVAFEPIGYRVPAAFGWLNTVLTSANLAALASFRLAVLMVCPSFAARLTFWLEPALCLAFLGGCHSLLAAPGAFGSIFTPPRHFFGPRRTRDEGAPLGQSFSHKAILGLGVVGHLSMLAALCMGPFLEVRYPLLGLKRTDVCAYMITEMGERHPR